MSPFLTAVLSPLRRGLAWIVRPLARRLDARLARILSQSVTAPILAEIEHSRSALGGALHGVIEEARRDVIHAVYTKVDDGCDRVINRVWFKVDDVGDRVINRVWIKVDDSREEVGPRIDTLARELRLLSLSQTPSTHTNVLLNSVVRELARLQAEVEGLRFQLSVVSADSAGSSDEAGSSVAFPQAPQERSMAG